MSKLGQYTNFDAPNAIIPELIDGTGDEFKWNAMVYNLNGMSIEDYAKTVFHTDSKTIDGDGDEEIVVTDWIVGGSDMETLG